jgi:hypothetical protein
MTSILTRVTALCGVAILGLAACTTSSQPSKEDMLSAAGFKMKLADTPEKMASLKQLTPLKFLHKNLHNKLLTLYADPDGCKCLYVGDQTAWQNYQQARLVSNIAQSTEEAAAMSNQTVMMNEDAAMGPWGWGPWGAESWGYGP